MLWPTLLLEILLELVHNGTLALEDLHAFLPVSLLLVNLQRPHTDKDLEVIVGPALSGFVFGRSGEHLTAFKFDLKWVTNIQFPNMRF